MIDLSRKSESLEAIPATDSKSPSVYYPTLHISSDETFEVPKGEFYAKVKLKKTSANWSEDENGKKRYSCTYDVMGMEPGECCESEDEGEDEDEKSEKTMDAAAAIMEAMKGARQKKIKE